MSRTKATSDVCDSEASRSRPAEAEPMAVARVLLLGLMGSGKTTVGQALASRLGWSYIDNDDLVEEFAGVTKASLVEAQGATELRAAEAQALRLAIRRPGPLVAGVAAGVVLDPDDAAPLEDPPDDVALVWLRARIDTLAERFAVILLTDRG